MKKYIWLVVIIAVIVVAYGAFRARQTSGAIKVGVILPLTGKAANFGEDIRIAIEMAKDEINASQNKKIELLYQDDGCDPKQAVSAYQFLRATEDVGVVIGSVCSPTTLAIAPLAEKEKVVLITPASSAETISDAGDFIFRNHSHDKAEIEKLAPYAISKYKRIAVLYDKTNDGFVLNAKFFAEIFGDLGGKIVDNLPVTGGSGDYRSEILKLRTDKDLIDAVFVPVITKDAVIIVKQMHEFGIKKPILGHKTFGTSDFVKNVGSDLAEGIVYAEAAYDKDTNPEFWNKYLARAEKTPAIWAPQAYDTLKILNQIFGICGGGNTECIKNELYRVKNYPGAAGMVSFDSKGDAIKEIAIKQIVNGNFIRVQ